MILLLLLLQATPVYLLPQAERDLTRPAGPLLVTDLFLRALESAGTEQDTAFRLRMGRFGFLGGEIEGERRGLSFETTRLFARYAERQGAHDVGLGWRQGRLRAQLAADVGPESQDHRTVFDASVFARFGRDVQLQAGGVYDTDPDSEQVAAGRVVRGASIGVSWHRATILEASLEGALERLRTSGLLDEDRDRVSAAVVVSPRVAQLAASLTTEGVKGRFGRRQWLVETQNAVELGPRVVLSQSLRTRSEAVIGVFDFRLGGGLTLFGRRHTFPRSGEAARRMRQLAYRAQDLGLFEDRSADDDSRRSFRERLALSPHREELAEDLRGLHAAQVAERNVPVLGFNLSRGFNDTNGSSDWRYVVSAGLPWPPTPPWAGREEAVEFLTLEYAQTRTTFKPGYRSYDRSVTLHAALNREASLSFSWTKPGVTPAELIRLQSDPRSLELAFSYVFGQ
ncbi:MAG TPA: hypothetical protein VFM88_14570 [Vicinamibacteria bacterium]|nr:hypothetical protein [Vicinamibacteria bacterium]